MHRIVDKYAVIGNPIGHSKSPLIHALFAQQTKQDLIYSAMSCEPAEFINTAREFLIKEGKGLNVTVPFKLDAFALADQHTEWAKRAGAVNTVWCEQKSIIADNTDGVGLIRDIKDHQHWDIKDKRVLILGAGGAVRGVLSPLLAENPTSIIIANRTSEKALQLANEFADLGVITGSSYTALEGSFDLIINGTSASLSGDVPPLSAALFHKNSACYDMMYGKTLTPFLEFVKTQGIDKLADGLGMLVEQAAEAFFIWRGIRPQTSPIIQVVRQKL